MPARPGTTPTVATGSLQIGEDLAFEARDLRAQRVGWAVMVMVATAAIAGVFGNGALSGQDARATEDGPTVLYERALRYATWDSVRITIPLSKTARDPVSVDISRDYLDAFEISSIVPEPEAVSTSGTAAHFTFATSGRTGGLDVRIHLRAMEWGRLRGWVRTGTSRPVIVSQFVWP